LIDIFQKDDIKYLLPIFIGGALSTQLVLGLEYILPTSPYFEFNGTFLQDFLLCFLKIGLVEEIAKALPCILFFRLFRNKIKEPIDILAFMCVSALGFSAAENYLYYNQYGPEIIIGRSILSSVAHMFNTALVAYGFIRYKYYHRKNAFLVITSYLLLAAFSHGFYDFWLIYEPAGTRGVVITIAYFLVTVSVFAVILNNAINNSDYFTYSKVIDSGKVSSRLLLSYGFIFLIQFLLIWHKEEFIVAFLNLFVTLFYIGFIVSVTVIRLSRFKLIKERWHPIKFELPFTYDTAPNLPGDNRSSFRIRGEAYNETFINTYYNDYCILSPVSSRNTFLEESRIAYIEEKLFLKDDDTFYLVRVYADMENNISFQLLVKPKISGSSFVEGKFPIVALLRFDEDFDINDTSNDLSSFEFLEWAYLKPRQHFR
jgi:RsiW-degrading membrane proteinase PrsW (M82 family)